MVSQVDEKDAAMVALAVHPARKADGFTDMGSAEFCAFVRTISVHDWSLSLGFRQENMKAGLDPRNASLSSCEWLLWAALHADSSTHHR
jgi:hypothetical protein